MKNACENDCILQFIVSEKVIWSRERTLSGRCLPIRTGFLPLLPSSKGRWRKFPIHGGHRWSLEMKLELANNTIRKILEFLRLHKKKPGSRVDGLCREVAPRRRFWQRALVWWRIPCIVLHHWDPVGRFRCRDLEEWLRRGWDSPPVRVELRRRESWRIFGREEILFHVGFLWAC